MTSGSTRPVGPHDLLDHLGRLLRARRAPGVADRNTHLVDPLDELLEPQRPVVGRRRQAEAVLDERAPCGSGRPRTGRAAAGTADVGLVDDDAGSRRGSSRAACRAPRPAPRPSMWRRVVLDAVAEADLLHHLEVVLGAHAQALRLEQLALLLELGQPLLQLGLDALDGLAHALLAGDVVRGREDDRARRARATCSPVSGSTTADAARSRRRTARCARRVSS